MHAYIDESRRGDRYFVTAVFVSSGDVANVRKFVESFIMTGAKRIHFTSESEPRRRKFLDELESLDLSGCSCLSFVVDGGDDQPARELCLEALFEHLVDHRVQRLILDQRSHDRDRLDRSCLARGVRAGRLPDGLVYDHVNSREEVLLALPDAVGWSIGQGGWARDAALRVPTKEIVINAPPSKAGRAKGKGKRKRNRRKR